MTSRSERYHQFLASKRHSTTDQGVELKDSYFKQARLNLEAAHERFVDDGIEQIDIFSQAGDAA